MTTPDVKLEDVSEKASAHEKARKEFFASKSVAFQTLMVAMEQRIPAMMISDPGLGKTSVIRSYAKYKDCTVVVLIGSRLEPQDVSGFPTKGYVSGYRDKSRPDLGYVLDYSEEDEGNFEPAEIPITEYAPQGWQHIIMTKKNVVLFLDEWSNTPPAVQASFLSMIQDRQFPNGDFFPKETIIVGAMNPPDTAADFFDMSLATTNRMMWIEWTLDTEEWCDLMKVNFHRSEEISSVEKEWRNLISRFVRENPQRMHAMPKAETNADTEIAMQGRRDTGSFRLLRSSAWASPRSWDNLAHALAGIPGKRRSNPLVEENIIVGLIGPSMAAKFTTWLESNDTMDVKDILRDLDAVPVEKWGEGPDSFTLNEKYTIVDAAYSTASSDNTLESFLVVNKIMRILAENGQHSVTASKMKEFVGMHHTVKFKMDKDNNKVPLSDDDRKEIGKKYVVPTITLYKSIVKRAGIDRRTE